MAYGISKEGFDRLAARAIPKKATADSQVLKGFVDVAWGLAWAEFWENLTSEYEDSFIEEAIDELGLNLSIPNFMGAKIEEIMDEPPQEVVQKCEEILDKIADKNNMFLAGFAEELGISSEELGNELAFRSSGSGGGNLYNEFEEAGFDVGYDLEFADLVGQTNNDLVKLENYLYENADHGE